MPSVTRSSRAPRTRARGSFFAALWVLVALGGCGDTPAGDPLEAIRQQQEAEDFAGSLEPLRQLLADHPNDAELYFLYGRALVMTQNAELASWSLRRAMEDPEWFVAAGSQLAWAELVTGDFNEVVEITTRILQQEPDDTGALLLRAQANAHWKKDAKQALADADRVLELDRDKIEAYEPRILALLTLERFDEARESLAEAGTRLVEVGASEGVLAWHCATTATFQQEAGDVDQARETWTSCLEAHPTNMTVVSGATDFYDAQGEPERSVEILRAALAAEPDSRTLRVGLATRLRQAGEAAEAEALLREATTSDDPGVAAAAWMDISRHRHALSEYAAAADALQKALELARQAGTPDPQLLFDYADALVLAGRFDRALEIAGELEVPAHAALIRGRVAQERRQPAKALEEFDEALRLWPDNPWARYYAALAAEELGEFDRALAEYRYAVRIGPSATDARTRGARLLFTEGKPALAMQMLVTAMGKEPLEVEGELLLMRIAGFLSDMTSVQEALERVAASHPVWAGRALAAAAEGATLRAGPAVALGMLLGAPVDYGTPQYAAALRAVVRLSHASGKVEETRPMLEQVLDAYPEAGVYQEIRALDRELSGAPPDEVRDAYQRALDLAPQNPYALAGLARLTLADDPVAAAELFERAAAIDPAEPDWQLEAARALAASGDPARARQTLDALLLEHPLEAPAAVERARLDLAAGIASPRTLELAQRAVRFGGGAEALELLSEVHARRDEPEPAARAAERARALREAQQASPS